MTELQIISKPNILQSMLSIPHSITSSIYNTLIPNKRDTILLPPITKPSFNSWEQSIIALDKQNKIDVWSDEKESNEYDHDLIQNRCRAMIEARDTNDIVAQRESIRSGLLRNLGGMNDPRLHSRSHLKSKKLIDLYIELVIDQIKSVAEADALDPKSKAQENLDFFHDTRQSFGGSALLLQGGITFGLYHLGVVKALLDAKLLPKIICGSSVGALIAALVCIHTDEELPNIFMEDGIDLKAFTKKSSKGSMSRKIERFILYRYLLDVKVIEDCVRSNVGDITFEEAYERTGRILNITVASTRMNETPRLLNYLTSPNVLIWSAACCSSALTGLYETVDLLAKDSNGDIVHWSPSTIKWSEATAEGQSTESRICELFNVNHFILSQANPYFAPLFQRSETLFGKFMACVSNEAHFRIEMIDKFGLIPKWIRGYLIEEKFQGHIIISPPISVSDLQTILSIPTHSTVAYWIGKGEQCVWPFLHSIRNRTAIELELDKALKSARMNADVVVREEPPAHDLRNRRSSVN